MIILLDTSTPVCKLTIVSGEEITSHEWQADRQLARGLLKFIDDKLHQAGGDIEAISGIGVMKGPGSFTGLRIGLAVANTLADSLGVNIVGETGSDWQKKALKKLQDSQNQQIVLPEYGAEANITKPRK